MSLTYSIAEEHQQLSIDVVELNNVVLAMRPLVKKAKVVVLRELALFIKRQKMKQSISPEYKSKRLGRKIVNKLSEIRLLKKFNFTKLCKLILANVYTSDMLEKGGGNLTKQDRIVTRLSSRPEISKFVENFRREHSDWPTLVHYLLYKNTSGKWKTSEQKRKGGRRKIGDLPFPIVDIGLDDAHHASSTIHKFKVFKEVHDRELAASQQRILEEEKAEDNVSSFSNEKREENEAGVDPRIHSTEDPEMKAFISKLISKVNSGEEIDESLLPGNLSSLVKVDKVENGHHESLNSEREGNSKLKRQKSKSRALAEEVEKKTREKGSRRKRRSEKSKPPSKSSDMVQQSKVDGDNDDEMLHEVIIEHIENEDQAFVEESGCEVIFGCDDLEMKQELKERKAKPGNSAVYKRYLKQRNSHNNQNQSHQSRYRRRSPGYRNWPSKHPLTPNKEAPLHPSWEAKRRQKAMVTEPIKIVMV